MAATVPLGEWGVLTVLGPDDPVPDALLAVRALWAGDPRRLPATLRFTRWDTAGAYVLCWPPDVPPPDPGGPYDLDGVAIAEAAVLRCFACGAEHDALYPDRGIPGFGVARHPFVAGCPSCGADPAASRIAALAIGPQR